MGTKIIWLFGIILILVISSSHASDSDITIIELTQTGCQFLEPEGVDHHYKTRQAEDCERINNDSGKQRVTDSKPIILAPGKYIFRITNRDVKYQLGFWLRGQGIQRFLLPSVSGGGLETGITKDYEITLAPGEYVYSCPLNPTPDYKLIVSQHVKM